MTSARTRPALVSVVVPVMNGERFIGEQLEALTGQSYSGSWEVLVVDNGCTDRTLEIAQRWRERLPQLRVVDARGKRGVNFARAAGAAAARGDFLVFCDADDVVAPGWLEALAGAAPKCDLVGGRVDVEPLNDGLLHAWRGGGAVTMAELNSGYGFLPYVSGGNCGVWTDVARKVGWDEAFMFGASDIEFAWRAQLAGYRAAFEPSAVIWLRYRSRLGGLAKQFFRYGAGEPLLYLRFRNRGMPRRDPLDACRTWRWLLRELPSALRSREVRGNWLRIAAGCCGRLWGSIRWRVVYL